MVVGNSCSNQFRPVTAQEETTWRMTRFGWKDLSTWERPVSKTVYRIEQVHPLTFSACVVVLSIAVLIWATEEHDWGRLFKWGDGSVRKRRDKQFEGQT